MNLYINGKKATICKVDTGTSGFVSVYVNNFASCHSLPEHWFNNQYRHRVTTSGNVYEWKDE